MKYAVETRHLCKSYGEVQANRDVSIQIEPGSVMCIIGENGAGKSTLMNLLFGLEKPTSGEILIDGKPVKFESSRDAIDCHIGMVHQHFMLVKELSVLENIILGSEPKKEIRLNYRKAYKEIQELGQNYGMELPWNQLVGTLPVGMQQKVEILKTLYRQAQILIFDEPTAVLTPQETKELFENIRFLASQKKTIILITHKLDEVMQISRDIIVMRRGEVKGQLQTAETSVNQLAEAMVGRKLPETAARNRGGNQTNVVISDIGYANRSNGFDLKNLSFQIHAGEILGIAGISGNGQSELAQVLAGLSRPDNGTIEVNGQDMTRYDRRQKMLGGISFISEDRMEESLCLDWSIQENAIARYHIDSTYSSKFGWMKQDTIAEDARAMIKQFDIRTEDELVPARNLSGGNQQKIVIARETIHNPHFVIAMEPTRGVDVGAIRFIHNELIRLRNSGVSILLISSDLDEIFRLSDRIAVMFEGEITANVDPKKITREEIGLYMSGAKRGNKDEQR